MVAKFLMGPESADEIAASFRTTRATLYRWTAKLLADNEPDTDGLRKLANR